MNVVCIDLDRNAALKTVELLRSAIAACHKSVAFIATANVSAATPADLFLGQTPDLLCFGSGIDTATLGSLITSIRQKLGGLPLLALFDPEIMTLPTLLSLEQLGVEVASTSDSAPRLVHILSSLAEAKNKSKRHLVVLRGVKGGVGTTSLAIALAHSAQGAGLRAAVLDLSRFGQAAQFLLAPVWESEEHRWLLFQEQYGEALVSKCSVVSECGIRVILPPAGGSAVRERWLTDDSLLEHALFIIENASTDADIVFVDLGGAEGILPFALEARASCNLLVSTNEPGSVHLLSQQLEQLRRLPATENICLALHQADPKGLTCGEVKNFVLDPELATLPVLAIPFDTRAATWIGTGNSPFTEAKESYREALDSLLSFTMGQPTSCDMTSRERILRALGSMFRRRSYRASEISEPLLLAPPQRTPLLTASSETTNSARRELPFDGPRWVDLLPIENVTSSMKPASAANDDSRRFTLPKLLRTTNSSPGLNPFQSVDSKTNSYSNLAETTSTDNTGGH